VTNLTKDQIKSLITDGWKCNSYGSLCSLPSHKNKTFRLIENPDQALQPEECAKDENFSGREGNAIILHIGEVNADIDPSMVTEERIVIPAGHFVFFLTQEIVNMPLDCDGTLTMNPGTSNRGLLFFTLGHVDPGFSGHLTATLLNTTSRDIPLKRGEGVLYLVISKLEAPSKPHAQYHEFPQTDIDQAMRDLSYNMQPGFALTTRDFATKKDLESTRNLFIAVMGISLTVIGIIIALLTLFV
jgi:deoxycytidine triphosphate deaminase